MRDSCPRTCAKEKPQQVPEETRHAGLDTEDAVEAGMADQSEAFKEAGGEIDS